MRRWWREKCKLHCVSLLGLLGNSDCYTKLKLVVENLERNKLVPLLSLGVRYGGKGGRETGCLLSPGILIVRQWNYTLSKIFQNRVKIAFIETLPSLPF